MGSNPVRWCLHGYPVLVEQTRLPADVTARWWQLYHQRRTVSTPEISSDDIGIDSLSGIIVKLPPLRSLGDPTHRRDGDDVAWLWVSACGLGGGEEGEEGEGHEEVGGGVDAVGIEPGCRRHVVSQTILTPCTVHGRADLPCLELVLVHGLRQTLGRLLARVLYDVGCILDGSNVNNG